MTRHKESCLQPELKIITYDEKRDAFMIRLTNDAPTPGLNDIYYCPTCGVKLNNEYTIDDFKELEEKIKDLEYEPVEFGYDSFPIEELRKASNFIKKTLKIK